MKAFLFALMLLSGFSGMAQGDFVEEVSHSETNLITASLGTNDLKNLLREWNLKTTVVAYESAGHANLKWNLPAKKALNAYALVCSGAYPGVEDQTIVTNCQTAIAAGCNDPLILFLNTKYGLTRQDLEPKKLEASLETPGNKLAEAFCESARKLNESQYPPIRKFYANLEASIYLNRSNKKTRNPHIFLEASHFEDLAISNLVFSLKDKTMPSKQICDDCKWLLGIFQGDPTKLRNNYILMEPELLVRSDRWVGLFVKAWFYINTAWQSRGGDYADKVTAQGWTNFNRRLEIAEKALDEAWELNSNEVRIPTAMLTLELGQGKGRERMEMWFKRAMELNPNNAAACEAKRYYLETKWYGSKNEMMAFCRECLNSKTWGGKVPLVLARQYASILQAQENFDILDAMKSPPGVFTASKPLPDDLKENFSWDEVKQAYKKYFEKNSGDIIERQRFIYLAGRGHHWDVVNEQLPFIGDVHSVAIFGRDWTFKQIVSMARESLNRKVPPPQISQRQHNDKSAKIGDPIFFKVDARTTYTENGGENSRAIPNYYQWRLNGTNLPNATNSTYTIEHAGFQDTGEYTVVVTNLGGSVTSSNGALWVYDPKAIPRKSTQLFLQDLRSDKATPTQPITKAGPPTIVIQPMKHKVKTGVSTYLIVYARKNSTNEAPMGVQWRLNEKDIIDTTNSTSKVIDLGSTISTRHYIKTVTFEDVGNYSVVITNSFGGVTSSNALLTVEKP